VLKPARAALLMFEIVLVASFAIPASAQAKDRESLLSLHVVAQPILDNPTQDNPFYLHAEVKKYKQTGQAAMYFEQPLTVLADALSDTRNWCSVLILHLNTKACTYNANKEGEETLTIYLGRKYYQDPDDAFVMTYRFETERQDNYFSALITAEKGPLGTSKYRIQLEVTAIQGRTFGRFQVSQKHSWISSRAAKLYIATVGRNKKGISIIGRDSTGAPIYSEGELAIAERNLLRYYFAFTAFFHTRNDTGTDGFNERLNYWYDQTEQYRQLYEVDRKMYIEDKVKELQNQLALQQSQYVDRESSRNQ